MSLHAGTAKGAVSLNPAQLDAVQTSDNIVCCACPGSGKTRVLIEKVKHVLKSHPNPRILMTTFSRDAADEMLDRIKKDQSVDQSSHQRLVIGTFHALALQQLRQAGKSVKVLSDIEAQHLIQRALAELRSNLDLKEAESIIARCKTDAEYARRFPDFAAITKRYTDLLAHTGAQDFTDLLLRANTLMANGSIKPIQATHVFGDEFQDIDRLQYQWLMHHMVQNPVACAVGDDDQAIYAFRSSMGYHGLMEFMAAADARIIHLSTNYRSTAGIVDSASRLIAGNIDRVPKSIVAQRGAGAQPTVIRIGKGESQAMRIIHLLDDICADNPPPPVLPERKPYRFGIAPKQAAVLARTNAQLMEVERTFIAERIPYLRAGKGFWDAKVLKVFVSILNALVKHEGMGLEIALAWAKIPDSTIRQILAEAGGSLWNLVREDSPVALANRHVEDVRSLITVGHGIARKLAEGNDSNAAKGAIRGVAAWMSNIMQRMTSNDDGVIFRQEGHREIKDLPILDAGRDALLAAEGNLRIRLQDVLREKEDRYPRVILSTFHGSKGLEWENVFLINVHEGSVPSIDADACEEALAEERRVMYVAMTRARDNLVIFSRTDMPVSEFLIEAGLLPASLVNSPQQDQLFS